MSEKIIVNNDDTKVNGPTSVVFTSDDDIAEGKLEKALKIYNIIETFINLSDIQNTMQVYQKTTKTWEGLRALADACDVIGYPKAT